VSICDTCEGRDRCGARPVKLPGPPWESCDGYVLDDPDERNDEGDEWDEWDEWEDDEWEPDVFNHDEEEDDE